MAVKIKFDFSVQHTFRKSYDMYEDKRFILMIHGYYDKKMYRYNVIENTFNIGDFLQDENNILYAIDEVRNVVNGSKKMYGLSWDVPHEGILIRDNKVEIYNEYVEIPEEFKYWGISQLLELLEEWSEFISLQKGRIYIEKKKVKNEFMIGV